jgi:hypothetical protein
MDAKTIERYHYWRKQGNNAAGALSYARYEQSMRDVLDRLGEWTFERDEAVAEFAQPLAGLTLRVRVLADDMDWGDIEPADEEREAASAWLVILEALDTDGEEAFSDSIGGVDAIDLPGYLQRDWEDAAAYALLEYLLPEMEWKVIHEAAERADAAARDIATV